MHAQDKDRLPILTLSGLDDHVATLVIDKGGHVVVGVVGTDGMVVDLQGGYTTVSSLY